MDKKIDLNELERTLRETNKAKCPYCEDGYLTTKNNPKTSPNFACTSCETQFNIN